MFGRGLSLAMAAASLVVGAAPAFSAPIGRAAVLPTPGHCLRSDKRKAQRRAAQGRTYARGDKLGRRLRRKFELGRAGAF